MDQKQFEAMLSDAETRLRRLKMLYEQWFMGFERTEPAVLRRELEDLLARLRKEQSNNTALRFRLQQLVQRHTTFSTYWRRIGRQIEEGTYQRDVLRAKRMRTRAGQERDNGGPELELSYDVDLDDELAAALEEAGRVIPAPAVALTQPEPTLAQAAPAIPPLQPATGAARSAAAPPAQPAVVQLAAARPGLALPRQPPLAAEQAALGAATAGARPAVPAPAGTRANAARSLSPFSVPAVNAAKPAPPVVANQPRPAPPPVASAQPLVANQQPTAAARPAAQPAPASPRAAPPAPSNPRPVQPAAPAAPAATRDATFSTDDVQRVYTQYLAARKQNAERVDNVRRETLEKTIRGMLPQLEKKHAGKKIDFEVVVKDGKVALKPVAK